MMSAPVRLWTPLCNRLRSVAPAGATLRALSLLAARSGAGARERVGSAVECRPRAAAAAPRAPRATRALFIRVESTPNPDSLKFMPEASAGAPPMVVLPTHMGTGVHFSEASAATSCALARKLLRYPEVTSVFLGPDFVSINKRESASWAQLRPVVLDALMDALTEASLRGGSIIEGPGGGSSGASGDSAGAAEEDDEVVAMIKELIEARIRPTVQEDGGDIFFAGFDAATGIVRLRMAGSCVGCPSSSATLKSGVENMLMHYVPEVKGVEQVKDAAEQEGDREFARVEAAAGAQGVTDPGNTQSKG